MLVAIPAWLLFLAGMARWLLTSTSPSTREPEQPLAIRLVELDPPPPPSSAVPIKPAAARSAHAARPRPAGVPPLPKQPAQPKLEAQSATQAATAPAAPENTQEKAAGAAPMRSPLTDDAAGASTSSGDSAARSIAQPLPELPDDLREQSYEAVAMVRLVIHVDGSVSVELIKPTPIPRLNQILLETLRKWRFFPAMQGGHPVESSQDIRVRFNVR